MTEPARSTLTVRGAGEVAAYRWRPSGEPRRIPLVLVHGYAEHALRHVRLARAAAEAGHEVMAIDLPGHGRSDGPRALVRSYEPMVAAVSAAVDEMRTAGGTRPVLFGHSMGGAVALTYALEQPSELSRLVLSAPYLLDATPRPTWLTALAGPVAALTPSLPVAKLDASALARDPAVGAAYVADPLVYSGGVPAASGHTLTRMGRELLGRARELAIPTLVLHGEADAVASVEGSRRLAAAAPTVVRLQTLDGAYHEMHNEPEETGVPERFLRAVLGFLTEN